MWDPRDPSEQEPLGIELGSTDTDPIHRSHPVSARRVLSFTVLLQSCYTRSSSVVWDPVLHPCNTDFDTSVLQDVQRPCNAHVTLTPVFTPANRCYLAGNTSWKGLG